VMPFAGRASAPKAEIRPQREGADIGLGTGSLFPSGVLRWSLWEKHRSHIVHKTDSFGAIIVDGLPHETFVYVNHFGNRAATTDGGSIRPIERRYRHLVSRRRAAGAECHDRFWIPCGGSRPKLS
jgi:hypothetical protein